MDFTCRPAATSAWIADSRPDPGPCTLTCTRRTPSVTASRPACSPATVAANGVDFLDPLKPAFPDDPHEMVFPWVSVIVMVVLLNVALTWAMPSASITRFAFFPIAMITSLPSSCRRLPGVGPSWCGRWCACAVHEPEVPGGDGCRGTSQCP